MAFTLYLYANSIKSIEGYWYNAKKMHTTIIIMINVVGTRCVFVVVRHVNRLTSGLISIYRCIQRDAEPFYCLYYVAEPGALVASVEEILHKFRLFFFQCIAVVTHISHPQNISNASHKHTQTMFLVISNKTNCQLIWTGKCGVIQPEILLAQSLYLCHEISQNYHIDDANWKAISSRIRLICVRPSIAIEVNVCTVDFYCQCNRYYSRLIIIIVSFLCVCVCV